MGNTTGITRGGGLDCLRAVRVHLNILYINMSLNSERESPTNAYATRSATK